MNLFLAQTEAGALTGLASLVSLLMFLSFFCSILCILVPIFIYRIMRNGTRAEEALLRIEQLLRYNKALTSQTPATPAAWPRDQYQKRPICRNWIDLCGVLKTQNDLAPRKRNEHDQRWPRRQLTLIQGSNSVPAFGVL